MGIIWGLKPSWEMKAGRNLLFLYIYKKKLNVDLNKSRALRKEQSQPVLFQTLLKEASLKPFGFLLIFSRGSGFLGPAAQPGFTARAESSQFWASFPAGPFFFLATVPTYVAELQGQALRGLELGSAQVQLRGGRFQLLGDREHLLGDVELRGQAEVERAAGLLGEADGNGFVARHLLRALTRLEQGLVSVLTDVWHDAVKGNLRLAAGKLDEDYEACRAPHASSRPPD